MSNAKLIQLKRSQARTLMDKFMISDNNTTKREIRNNIHNLWEEVRLLQLEDKIPKKENSST
jgi:nitrogen-specific signal transduction histidine kinase